MKKFLITSEYRVSGLDPVRLELHFQLFDELMRQVTVNSPERGTKIQKLCVKKFNF
jgi:hypothetical protein